jgi:hypothetical protein
MARQRRGGLRPPELRGTLGTLIRTAVPAVRDVLERGAREGRARLDDALSGRRRNDSLAELGEIVLDLIRRGEIDIAELPEVQDVVAHLDELDSDEPPTAPPPRGSIRKRFDDRNFDPKRTIDQRPRGRRTDEDDTVSSRSWSAPKPAPKAAQPARVWRPTPPADSPATDPRSADARPADEITARGRPATPKKGGISFDDDDSDLADYMHPDDVPPKSKGDS